MRKLVCAVAAVLTLVGCKEAPPKLPQIAYIYLENPKTLVHLDHGKAPGEVCARALGYQTTCDIHPGDGHFIRVGLSRDGRIFLSFPEQTPDYHLMNY